MRDLGGIDDLPMEARIFEYIVEQGLLFVGLGDGGVAKLGNIFSLLPNSVTAVGGMIQAYREKPPGSLNFSKLWEKQLKSSVSIIEFAVNQGMIRFRHCHGTRKSTCWLSEWKTASASVLKLMPLKITRALSQ